MTFNLASSPENAHSVQCPQTSHCGRIYKADFCHMGKFWLPFVANATHLIIIKTIILTANIYRYWAIFFDCAPDVPGFGLEQTVAVAFPFDLLCVLSLLFVFSDFLFFFNFCFLILKFEYWILLEDFLREMLAQASSCFS